MSGTERIAYALIRGLYQESRDRGLELVKIQGVKTYLEGIAHVRGFAIFIIVLSLLLTLTVGGWGLFVLGMGLILQLEGTSLGLFLIATGALTVLIPILIFTLMNRESRWMKVCGAKELTDQLLHSNFSRTPE